MTIIVEWLIYILATQTCAQQVSDIITSFEILTLDFIS